MRQANWGIISIYLLVIPPLLIWLSMFPLSFRWGTFSQSATSLAQLSGLTGLVLFAVTIVLSARPRFLEKYFGGLGRMYIIHHQLGGLSLILLIFHPIFSAVKLVPISLTAAAASVMPGVSWPINFGWLALGLLIALLILTLYLRPPYHIWKWLHRWLGLAFGFAGLHAFLIPSDIAQNLYLRSYILGLVSIAGLFYISHSLLKWKRKATYVIEKINQLNAQVTELILHPAQTGLSFTAGQFAFFSFQAPPGSEWHPFSFSSAPTRSNQIIITVKSSGDFTDRIRLLTPGTSVLVEGPYGQFSYQRYPRQQVWIAGGIGIVPFYSMACDLVNHPSNEYNVNLFYSVNQIDEAVYLTQLNQIATSNNSSLQLWPWITKTQGYLTASAIAQTVHNWSTATFLICGPPPMINSLRQQLLTLHIDNQRIVSEEFGL